MADQTGPSSSARLLAAALPALAALLVACLICLFHFARHYKPGVLPPDAMETVQAARYLAQTGDFGTNVIRPLLTSSLSTHGDGSLPDLSHGPLHIALCAGLMKLTRHTFYGVGDQDAVLISVGCFVASLAACYALFSRCFGHRGALLACLLYGMGGTALSASLIARPTLLAALLFTLVTLALVGADQSLPLAEIGPRLPDERDETARLRQHLVKRSTLWAAAAGGMFGLLYLSVYSTLILVPVLLSYLWLVSGRQGRAPVAFLAAALLVTSPILFKTYRATGYPFYNTRLVELVMHTPTYPGYSLYRAASPPLPLAQYLAEGGAGEVARKAGANLLGFYGQAPSVLGAFLLPLLLGSALTRFAEGRVNRLRGLLWACLGLHLAGLSLFQPYEETAPLALMYLPVASVVGVGFLLSVVRARNLPRFYRNAVLTGWLGFGCLPGVLQLAAAPPTETDVSEVYYYLNTNSAQMQKVRRRRSIFLASDAPWEVAFRCDYPAVWLPQDAGVLSTLRQRTGRAVDGVVLDGDVKKYTDPDVAPWQLLYSRLVSVSELLDGLNVTTRNSVVGQIRVYYPQELSSALNGFKPIPQSEREGLNYTLLLWNPKLDGTVSAGGKR